MSTQESQSNLEENQEFQPTKEDIRKIHDEINQIVNQRIEVTTFAFLTFGAVLGWSIPKSSSEGDAGQLCYFISSALLILLFCFFFLTHRLTYMLRIFRTYLNITGHSEWEKHWAKYRELGGHHHGGYMRTFNGDLPRIGLYNILVSISSDYDNVWQFKISISGDCGNVQ